MKKILFLIFIILPLLKGNAQTPVPDYDKGKHFQFKSMEIPYWWSFAPSWYYRFFHRGYRATYSHSLPKRSTAIAAALATKLQARDEAAYFKEQEIQEEIKFVDRTVDIAYGSTSEVRNSLKRSIEDNILLYTELGGNDASQLVDEYKRIMSQVSTVQNAHLENAKRSDSYLSIEEQLKEFNSCIKMLCVLQASMNNINN